MKSREEAAAAAPPRAALPQHRAPRQLRGASTNRRPRPLPPPSAIGPFSRHSSAGRRRWRRRCRRVRSRRGAVPPPGPVTAGQERAGRRRAARGLRSGRPGAARRRRHRGRRSPRIPGTRSGVMKRCRSDELQQPEEEHGAAGEQHGAAAMEAKAGEAAVVPEAGGGGGPPPRSKPPDLKVSNGRETGAEGPFWLLLGVPGG